MISKKEKDGKRSWCQVQEELMLELRLSHTWREPRLNVSKVIKRLSSKGKSYIYSFQGARLLGAGAWSRPILLDS